MNTLLQRILALLALMLLIAACTESVDQSRSLPAPKTGIYEHGLTELDLQFLRGFSLSSLPPLPAAADNQYADDEAAAELGRRLFFDPGLSANGEVACASCHQPARYFTDGRQRGEGIGFSQRNTLTLLGASYGPWKYWDGRKDSLWAQALEPLENPQEHGFSRESLSSYIINNYATEYRAVFAEQPVESDSVTTRLAVNIAKALMAYQRKLNLRPAKFDRMVDSLLAGEDVSQADRFSRAELNGMRLFMGKGACASCHNGPLFTNFEFHNIGAPEAVKESVDLGRYAGIELLREDEFNCLSEWSDADADAVQCAEMQFLKNQGPELVGAFKTPSLRNVVATAPYMHAGQFATIADVLAHYNAPAPPFYDRAQHPSRPHFDILPLGLDDSELQDLAAFLGTLTSPLPDNDRWWFFETEGLPR